MRVFAHAYGSSVNVVLTWQNPSRDTRIVTTLSLGGFSGGGVHNDFTGRSEPDCHPIGAITDLEDKLIDPCAVLVASIDESGMYLDGLATYSGPGAATVGVVVQQSEGVKSIIDASTYLEMDNLWLGGFWKVQFKATVDSIANSTYVRITLYEWAAGPTYTAIGWTHDFPLTATAETDYSQEIEIAEYFAGSSKKLVARIEAYTDSVGARMVIISGGGTFRIHMATIAPLPTGVAGEPALGNPASNGYVLSSTVAGARSWIAPGGGVTPAMVEYLAMMMG